jgi:hypothetical protein
MAFSLRLSGAAALAAAAFLMAAPLLPAGDAAAQGARTPAGPKAQPWDDRVKRFYGRGEPQREVDRALQRLYRDPLHDKLGLPENKLDDPQAPAVPTAPPGFDPGTSRLDSDRDGTISRQEYFQGNTRAITPGFRGEQRYRQGQERLDSQFRNADRNRDGKITPGELQRGSRF